MPDWLQMSTKDDRERLLLHLIFANYNIPHYVVFGPAIVSFNWVQITPATLPFFGEITLNRLFQEFAFWNFFSKASNDFHRRSTTSKEFTTTALFHAEISKTQIHSPRLYYLLLENVMTKIYRDTHFACCRFFFETTIPGKGIEPARPYSSEIRKLKTLYYLLSQVV